jgi:hypothetical protein
MFGKLPSDLLAVDFFSRRSVNPLYQVLALELQGHVPDVGPDRSRVAVRSQDRTDLVVLPSRGEDVSGAVAKSIDDECYGSVVLLAEAVAGLRLVGVGGKAIREGRTRLDSLRYGLTPNLQTLTLGELERQKRVDKVQPLRLDLLWSKDLKEALPGRDRAAALK